MFLSRGFGACRMQLHSLANPTCSSSRGHRLASPCLQSKLLPPGCARIMARIPGVPHSMAGQDLHNVSLQWVLVNTSSEITCSNLSPPLIFSSASRALLCFSHRMWRTLICVAGFNFAGPLYGQIMHFRQAFVGGEVTSSSIYCLHHPLPS